MTPLTLPADAADRQPKVIAWRDYWLSHSETFIREQIDNLTNWQAISVGRRTYADPLVVPDYAPYSDSLNDRIASWLPSSRRVRNRYSELLQEPDVKLVHAHFGQDGLTALPYARRAGKPLIVSFYGMDATSLPHRNNPRAIRYRRKLPELFEQADALIVVSKFLGEQIEALGAPPAKIHLIYPGTRVRPAPSVADPRSGIIFVGRLVEKKGVPDLLRAVGMLPEPYRAVPITVVGYGPLLAELRKSAAELGLDVTFLGRRTSAEIADLLRVHAIFCGPSQRAANGDAEGLGMVFIEAALAGLPVVAYRHGGVVEAVDDLTTGLLAPEGDVGILSSNLAALLSEPDRAAALGRAGARRAADLFELSTQAAELERLYDHIAAVHAGDPGPTSPGSRTTDQLRGAGEGELTFQYEHEMPMKGQS